MKIKKHLNFASLRKKASEIFQSAPDWRQMSKITISIHDAMMSGLACMYFQDSSLLQFQKRMEEEQHKNNLNTVGLDYALAKVSGQELVEVGSRGCFATLNHETRAIS